MPSVTKDSQMLSILIFLADTEIIKLCRNSPQDISAVVDERLRQLVSRVWNLPDMNSIIYTTGDNVPTIRM